MAPAERQPGAGEASGGEVRLAAGVVVPERVLGFTYVSSSGPGGQNVNKRATKARLRVRVSELGLRPAAERRLVKLAGSLMTDEGEIVISCDTTRSQRGNKEECLGRLRELVAKSLVAPRPRKATKPTRGSVERRLKAKQIRSERKGRRRDGGDG